MLPQTTQAEIQRIEGRLKVIDQMVDSVDPVIQGIFASQLVLSGAGLIERSVIETLGEYGRRKGDPRLSRYVQKTVGLNNSLNCSKIEKILLHFDKDWWNTLKEAASEQELTAVDSLKTLRDQIAHGGQCGAGFTTVKGYFAFSKTFVAKMAAVVLVKV